MKARRSLAVSVVAAGVALSAPAFAQMPAGWTNQVDGLSVIQGDADLSGGGEFTASRQFLRGTSIYNLGSGNSIGLSTSLGRFDYDFTNLSNQPWSDIQDVRFSLPVRLSLGGSATLFLSPEIRWDYEDGASPSDGQTYGIFAGIAWKLSDSLTVGPAFGAYSQLEDSGADVFPALLINWDITDRWNLTTGAGLGATGGPGLTLGYELDETMKLSLSARSESVRFRLDDTGLAPGGVGEDKSIPVVLSFEYSPNPGLLLAAFAGAEFDGELTLEDASGVGLSRQSYDTAPLLGVAARLRF